MVDGAFLCRIPIFGGLSDDDLALVARVLEERVYEPGAVIVQEGAPGRELYVIADGRADVLKRAADGGETKIAELAGTLDFPGQFQLQLAVECGNLFFELLDQPILHRPLGSRAMVPHSVMLTAPARR